MRAYQKIQKIIVFLAVALLLVCAFSAFAPHIHDCDSADCVICDMLETPRWLLLALFLILGIEPAPQSRATLRRNLERLSFDDKNLVNLKVKLSN